jgi:N6-adenosine-specific RNA methylase IME4
VILKPKQALCDARPRLVDEVVWVKMTVNRRLAKSHGYYLQHAKEVCLVGKKGPDPPRMQVCFYAGCLCLP